MSLDLWSAQLDFLPLAFNPTETTSRAERRSTRLRMVRNLSTTKTSARCTMSLLPSARLRRTSGRCAVPGRQLHTVEAMPGRLSIVTRVLLWIRRFPSHTSWLHQASSLWASSNVFLHLMHDWVAPRITVVASKDDRGSFPTGVLD